MMAVSRAAWYTSSVELGALRSLAIVLCAAACLAAGASAIAGGLINMPTKIDNTGSPIQITQCLAGRNNDIGKWRV
jgi:hypothetical protein